MSWHVEPCLVCSSMHRSEEAHVQQHLSKVDLKGHGFQYNWDQMMISLTYQHIVFYKNNTIGFCTIELPVHAPSAGWGHLAETGG